MRKFLAKVFATYIYYKNRKWIYNPIEYQKKTFKKLINKASGTKFGIEHNFNKIKSYKDYKDKVPVRDYEQIKPYIDIIIAGEDNVLWPGKPVYLSKSNSFKIKLALASINDLTFNLSKIGIIKGSNK